MILTKVNQTNGNTYITIHSRNATPTTADNEVLSITVQGKATVEINNQGNALYIKPEK